MPAHHEQRERAERHREHDDPRVRTEVVARRGLGRDRRPSEAARRSTTSGTPMPCARAPRRRAPHRGHLRRRRAAARIRSTPPRAVRVRVELERPAEQQRPLADTGVGGRGERAVGLEPQLERRRRAAHERRRMARSAVLDDRAQPVAEDPVGGHVEARRQGVRGPLDLELGLDAALAHLVHHGRRSAAATAVAAARDPRRPGAARRAGAASRPAPRGRSARSGRSPASAPPRPASARRSAAWAWTTMTLTSWAIRSCRSRAMRARSAVTAAAARASRLASSSRAWRSRRRAASPCQCSSRPPAAPMPTGISRMKISESAALDGSWITTSSGIRTTTSGAVRTERAAVGVRRPGHGEQEERG